MRLSAKVMTDHEISEPRVVLSAAISALSINVAYYMNEAASSGTFRKFAG